MGYPRHAQATSASALSDGLRVRRRAQGIICCPKVAPGETFSRKISAASRAALVWEQCAGLPPFRAPVICSKHCRSPLGRSMPVDTPEGARGLAKKGHCLGVLTL